MKNTPHAIDRDYPPEIATARKQLWPEVKRLRNSASSSDNIQLKYPAKIVMNGKIVQNAFPYWDTLIKASVCGDFRYITQDELLLPTTSVPGVPCMPANPSVPVMASGSNRDNYIYPSQPRNPQFQMPLMPPPPPPQSLFMSREQNVNMRTTILQPNMPTSYGWQSPRPPRSVRDVNLAENQTNLPNSSAQTDASKQLSPSILSQSFQRDYSSAAPLNLVRLPVQTKLDHLS